MALASLLTLTGCGSADGEREGASSGDGGSQAPAPPADSQTSSAPTTPTTEAKPVVPPPVPFLPLPGEVGVAAKRAAADIVVAAGTYNQGGGTDEGARQRIEAIGGDPSVAGALAQLLVPEASASVEVVYPQLGGLTDTQASIILVVRHHLAEADSIQSVTRTLDVRAERSGETWRVTQVASAGGAPPTDGVPPSEAAQAALADPRLTLPDTVRWDIEAGRVDDRVLAALVEAAAVAPLSVTTTKEGHPVEVFGTSRTSNHTEGRGVDIWAVDGTPVISLRGDASAARRVVDALFASTVEELGSPWDLDGAGAGRSFTNTVHQDHLHLAFDR